MKRALGTVLSLLALTAIGLVVLAYAYEAWLHRTEIVKLVLMLFAFFVAAVNGIILYEVCGGERQGIDSWFNWDRPSQIASIVAVVWGVFCVVAWFGFFDKLVDELGDTFLRVWKTLPWYILLAVFVSVAVLLFRFIHVKFFDSD